MAVFSRRTIQRILNENALFLTPEQIDRQVARLNRSDFQSLDAEWEVVVLNAFSKLGVLTHEPALEGDAKLDLLIEYRNVKILADVTSVSDEGFEEQAGVKAFELELKRRLEKQGLLYKGWSLSVGEHRVKYGERRRPALPPRAEFTEEIFNSRFKEFLLHVKEHPEIPQTYNVSTEKTAIVLTYHPSRNSFMMHLPVYNSAIIKNQNPVFNALKSKAKQHKKVVFNGYRGIILCDGGSDMVHGKSHGAFGLDFNAEDATRDFLRQNQSIDFVAICSSVRVDNAQYYSGAEKSARKIQVKIINNTFRPLPNDLNECLEKLEQQFPEPINTAGGARETIRHGYDPKKLMPLAGRIGWKHNEISISASAVLSLLAGTITQDELFEALGFNGPHAMGNLFEYILEQKMRIVEIKVEDTLYDDSMLIFKFDAPDPAISEFKSPKGVSDSGSSR